MTQWDKLSASARVYQIFDFGQLKRLYNNTDVRLVIAARKQSNFMSFWLEMTSFLEGSPWWCGGSLVFLHGQVLVLVCTLMCYRRWCWPQSQWQLVRLSTLGDPDKASLISFSGPCEPATADERAYQSWRRDLGFPEGFSSIGAGSIESPPWPDWSFIRSKRVGHFLKL